jgi:Fur family peroxide stress response transcriptional regulator
MVQREEVERRLLQFPQLCRQAGLKVTPQRGAVYAMLAATDEHPTPEAIHHSVRELLPNLSLATVYKILDQFAAHGMLLKVSNPEQAARYDARVDSHQHTVCAACGRIGDVVLEPLNRALERLPFPAGFHVSRVDVVLHGLCAACTAKADRPAS